MASESECTPCVGGMACDVEGLISPIRTCSAGYYCRVGANMTTPELGNYLTGLHYWKHAQTCSDNIFLRSNTVQTVFISEDLIRVQLL